ncbi:MAG: hypothetical protein QOH31_3122, partial [Verrucomicrobiota bacterium]
KAEEWLLDLESPVFRSHRCIDLSITIYANFYLDVFITNIFMFDLCSQILTLREVLQSLTSYDYPPDELFIQSRAVDAI